MTQPDTNTIALLVNDGIALQAAEDEFTKRLNAHLKGKKITVTHEYFNGQQHGSSWPKLKGQTFQIDHAIFYNGKISVWFNGSRHYCYMPLSYGEISND